MSACREGDVLAAFALSRFRAAFFSQNLHLLSLREVSSDRMQSLEAVIQRASQIQMFDYALTIHLTLQFPSRLSSVFLFLHRPVWR